MALKTLMLRREIDMKKRDLAKLQSAKEDLEKRRAELEASIAEVETDEQRDAVNAEIEQFEADEKENTEQTVDLERAISDMEAQLEEEEAAQNTEPEPAHGEDTRGENAGHEERSTHMKIRTINEEFVTRQDVKSFLEEVRSAMREKRALSGAGLLIPDSMLGLVREEINRNSKLLPFVNLRQVGGTARMNIMGKIPEAIWTEMCANINEIDLTFNQVEVDGYKVGAAIVVCNATLEDSDIALANEIVSAIGTAIAKALDKAILFGTGTKMPIGIATRLAASSEPSWWGTHEPDFTDLHTSHVRTINKSTANGAEFFMALIAELALAKPVFNSDGLFWVMNRKTHLDIMARALAFNSAAALVANTDLFPIVGGTVVEIEDDNLLADYEIIGGYGGNYLMAERAGIQIDSSKEYRFLEDQTAFKGTGRYDGRPLCGEAFVIVNYANTSPTTSKSFAADDANTVESIRMNTVTATVASGSTLQLHAITEPGSGAVTWASATTSKATVDSTGKVTGVASGSSVITATCNGLTAQCTVTVTSE